MRVSVTFLLLQLLGTAPLLADADRVAAIFRESHALFRGDAQPLEVVVEACLVTLTDFPDPDAFASVRRLDLAVLELSQPSFVYRMSDTLTRLTISETPDTSRALAPALWRLMGGTDEDRPPVRAILDTFADWDPLGMGSWADPSMMTSQQQAEHDRAWERALDGEGGDVLADNHVAWFGPEVSGQRRVWRMPGGAIQIGVAAGEVEPTMTSIRNHVAEICP